MISNNKQSDEIDKWHYIVSESVNKTMDLIDQ